MHIADAVSSIVALDRCLPILPAKRYDGQGIRPVLSTRMTIALPLTDFSSGRTDPRGDTTQRESRFRRRRQSRRAGYKSDYRNIANVIFPASGCEPSHIGDSVYWLLLGSSWMKDGVVRPIDIPPSGIPFAKSLLRQRRLWNRVR